MTLAVSDIAASRVTSAHFVIGLKVLTLWAPVRKSLRGFSKNGALQYESAVTTKQSSILSKLIKATTESSHTNSFGKMLTGAKS